MKYVILVVMALALSGCATLSKGAEACRMVLAEPVCALVDVVEMLGSDLGTVKDNVTGASDE